ncbi:DUF6957 family protein [Shewanella vesiculosa]|jgi:hypothetical protein|uniref:DUF6957 family protein n=1 Tax=Shewanella vesiculosa TaxID=518738 RepID=UPI003CFF1DDB
MNNIQTILRDWYIVKILDEKQSLIGQVLWAFVVEDNTGRFNIGDYLCTSLIVKINNNLIITASGSEYIVEGIGKEFEADIAELEQLRRGHSPFQVSRLRKVH